MANRNKIQEDSYELNYRPDTRTDDEYEADLKEEDSFGKLVREEIKNLTPEEKKKMEEIVAKERAEDLEEQALFEDRGCKYPSAS